MIFDEIQDCRRVAFIGQDRRILRSLAFGLAHHVVQRDAEAIAMILVVGDVGPPLVVASRPRCLEKPGQGFGDGPELDRIWFKYCTEADALAYCAQVHLVEAKPTLLVLDSWDGSLALLKLLDDATSYLDASACVVVPNDDRRARHFFPTVVHVRGGTVELPALSRDWREPHRTEARFRIDDNHTHLLALPLIPQEKA